MYPPAVEAWKIEGYKEGFRRFDDIASTLGTVAKKMDTLLSKDADMADGLLIRVRQSLAQRVEFQLDLTGLRGDRPDAVPIEQCFVVPELGRIVVVPGRYDEHQITIGTEAEIVDTFIQSGLRALVVGAPGSGKSTWSRWLQKISLSQNQPRLAVLVRLRDLVQLDKLPSYMEIVRDAAGTHLREEVNAATVREWCQSGAITFILDGFDEIPPVRRDAMLDWIKGLGVAVDKAGLIMTSRPLTSDHLEELNEPWLRWDLLPFDQPRIVDYISRWYAHAPLLAGKAQDIDANNLAELWLQDAVLQPLVGTPLMLATLLMVHHMDGELPRGRAKLYDRYIDGMLGLWDSRWGVPAAVDLTPVLKKRILTRLALHLHLTEIEQLGDDEIRQWFADTLPNLGCSCSSDAVLNHLRERTGLLVGPGTWSFVHKSVGEFLVATAIRDGDQMDNAGQKVDRLRLFRERHNDRWNTVLFFWSGLTAPGDLHSFIEQVIEEPGNADFVLALSLIYDQLLPYRLTESWLGVQLPKLLKKEVAIVKGNLRSRFIWSPSPSDINNGVDLKFDTYLRALDRADIHMALWECLKTSRVTWRQVSDCHEALLFLVWVYFVTEPKTLDDLRSALSAETKPHPLPDEWMYLGLDWGIRTVAQTSHGINLPQYLEVFRDCVPEKSGIVVFFLIGNFMEIMMGKDMTQHFAISFFQNLLQAIEASRSEDVDADWLQLTTKYVPGLRDNQDLDLLDKFLENLDTAIPKEWALDESLIANVRSFVLALRDRRDKVLPVT